MEQATDEALIAAYLAHYRAAHKTGAPDKEKAAALFWASEQLQEIIEADSEHAWRIVIAMIDETTDEATLAYIAAGPLEDILSSYGTSFIERTEIRARQNPHFKKTLQNIFAHAVAQDIRERFIAIIK